DDRLITLLRAKQNRVEPPSSIPANEYWWLINVYDAGSQALVSDPVTVFVAGYYNLYQFRVSLVDRNASLVDTFPWLNSLEHYTFGQTISTSSDTVTVLNQAGQSSFVETFPFVPNTGRALADTEKIYRGFVFENVTETLLLQSTVPQTALVLTTAGLYMLNFGEPHAAGQQSAAPQGMYQELECDLETLFTAAVHTSSAAPPTRPKPAMSK
ncbi:hypothetical protein HK405_015373, partial [Cladochytrium tenue]